MRTFLSTTGMMVVMMTALMGASLFAEEITKIPSNSTKKSSMTSDISPEHRLNMAAMHYKMAACLRTAKPIEECRKEMKTSCQSMGQDGCYSMGMKHQGNMMNEKDVD